MHRGLFLGEGSSDGGIAFHIERIAMECGVDLQLTAPDTEMLPLPDKSVAGKLKAVKQLGGEYEIVFIHRDADGAGRQAREREIRAAVDAVMPETSHVAVVPVRMTEAWLLLDESSIREVAGNPNGRVKLNIPSAREVERIADPKALLKDLIVTASETTGRRRRTLHTSFPHSRRRLLEELDPRGAVRLVDSWRRFVDETAQALQKLDG